ncbi:MAG: alginate export family protein [Pseudomonadota bacterium]
MTPVSCLHVQRVARNTSFNRLALAVLVAAAAVPAARADALGDAIAGGKTNLELRYRLENVEQDGFAKEANASTLRTRLRYATGEWQSMTALVELDSVSRVGEERYNSGVNGKAAFPVVADPAGAGVNQAFLKYVGIGNTVITAGRQRVNLDGQRYVGSVAWRQNEQTLDGVLVEFKGVDRLTATYGFVNQVNRIYGPSGLAANLAEFDGESHLVNLKYVTGEALTGVLYAYMLDFDNAPPALSSQTVGLRLSGKVPAGSLKFGYTGEYAQQSDYKDNPASFEAPYMLAEFTLGGAAGAAATWEAQLGYEVLGEDSGVAVQTPLATLHKFQGWADKFLSTPAVGLIDTYLGGTVTVKGVGITLVAHEYEGDANGADYGSELNAQVSKTFAKRYTLALKYADYSQGDVAAVVDTTKMWLTGEAKF